MFLRPSCVFELEYLRSERRAAYDADAKCQMQRAVDRACSSRIGRGVMAWMTVPSRPQGWRQCSRSHEDAAAFVLTYNRTLGWNLCGKGGYPIVLAELSGAGRRNFGGAMVSTTKVGDAVRHDMNRATPYTVQSASSHRPDATRISSAVRAKNSDRRRVGGALGSAPLATEFSVRRVSGAIGTRRTNLNQREGSIGLDCVACSRQARDQSATIFELLNSVSVAEKNVVNHELRKSSGSRDCDHLCPPRRLEREIHFSKLHLDVPTPSCARAADWKRWFG